MAQRTTKRSTGKTRTREDVSIALASEKKKADAPYRYRGPPTTLANMRAIVGRKPVP
jgi:hypothetical protein